METLTLDGTVNMQVLPKSIAHFTKAGMTQEEAIETWREIDERLAAQLKQALEPLGAKLDALSVDVQAIKTGLQVQNGAIENLRHDIGTVKWMVVCIIAVAMGSVALNYNLLRDHSHAPVAAK